MDNTHPAQSPSPRARGRRLALMALTAFAVLPVLCASVLPSAAQTASSAAPTAVSPRSDSRTLFLQLDRMLAEGRRDEANSAFEQLKVTRETAVAAGLELLERKQATSELTVSYLCSLASEEVPAVMGRSVMGQVLPSTTLGDMTKMGCINKLADSLDGSFRVPLEQLATDPGRNPNLRITALNVATSKWPAESHPTLVQLLQSSQDPVMHHKAQQYLVYSGGDDTNAQIEQFVLNRDPATKGDALPKEYGLLLLRFRLKEDVLPLLDSILRDETWASEIQDRAIDLLANSDLPGGPALLRGIRSSASDRLISRIDALVRESE